MKITGIGFLKAVTEGVCGLKCVDLSNDTIKVLGIHISYNKNVQMQNNSVTTIKKYRKLFICEIQVCLTLRGELLSLKL